MPDDDQPGLVIPDVPLYFRHDDVFDAEALGYMLAAAMGAPDGACAVMHPCSGPPLVVT
jgi:hypothetical protein